MLSRAPVIDAGILFFIKFVLGDSSLVSPGFVYQLPESKIWLRVEVWIECSVASISFCPRVARAMFPNCLGHFASTLLQFF